MSAFRAACPGCKRVVMVNIEPLKSGIVSKALGDKVCICCTSCNLIGVVVGQTIRQLTRDEWKTLIEQRWFTDLSREMLNEFHALGFWG